MTDKPESQEGPLLGALERLNPRSVWPREDTDFTPWLAAHPEALASALGIDLEITEMEHLVGPFRVDLLGRDLTFDKILIVENQLEDSDHGHLGQLMTYAAGTDAATIVWITTSLREEHRQALEWLNQQTGVDTHFFGVEIEVVHIGNSLPAPLLNVVVAPNDWQKAARNAATAAGSSKSVLYANFWDQFLTRLRTERPQWTRATRAPSANWFAMSVGVPTGCSINAVFGQGGRLRTELYIDRGTVEETSALYERIESQKTNFETAYGRNLSWEPLESRRASRIADHRDGMIESTEEYTDYFAWLIETGDHMRRALAAISLS